jgi:hypothetical protein
LLALAAAAVAVFLLTKDSDGSAAEPLAVSAATPATQQASAVVPAHSSASGDGKARPPSRHTGASGGQRSGPRRDHGWAAQAAVDADGQPAEAPAPADVAPEAVPKQPPPGAGPSDSDPQPIPEQPPNENPQKPGPRVQVPPDEPDTPGHDKPAPDHGDPHADGSDEPPGK